MIRVSAYRWVPPLARGLVKDLRVRWALEEARLPYEQRLIGLDEKNSQAYRRLQPFAQVPAYEEDGLILFESGAIVLHIAQRSDALLPPDPVGRARATAWMFAALSSMEPFIQEFASVDLFYADQEWAKMRRPGAEEMARTRLTDLAAALDGREYLEDRFTAGDLLMTTVLRILRHTDLVARFPVLAAYQARCEERLAFRRALAAQMAAFTDQP